MLPLLPELPPLTEPTPTAAARAALLDGPGLSGLLVTAGPTHADELVQITESADPVTVGTPYTYTVTVVPGRDLFNASDSISGPATITSADNGGDPSLVCSLSATSYYRYTAQSGLTNSAVLTLTVLPHAAGTVTASGASEANNRQGSDSITTTVNAAPPVAADIDVDVTAQPHLGILVL
ncbi:hypothetical protein ACIO3O_00120 [Streptomyces sp. NPDC087440]|uniref:hypothetical protein n=1 Tax=Streptomyces sp. NPDC087440 TaxID=3365790 RepID=UPI0037FD71D0